MANVTDSSSDDTPVCRGHWGTVEYAVCSNGQKLAERFVLGLKQSDQQKLARLFIAMASTGEIRNREKFKKVEGKIFEFKCHQIRIGCFQVGLCWFLTHGFIKKQDDWPKSELDRAVRVMSKHERPRGR
jgi:hypothetical protein